MRPFVAGVTEAGITALPDLVQERLTKADCIIAATRFHADLPSHAEILDWPTPFSNIFNILEPYLIICLNLRKPIGQLVYFKIYFLKSICKSLELVFNF